jgi:hypothetical protein
LYIPKPRIKLCKNSIRLGLRPVAIASRAA